MSCSLQHAPSGCAGRSPRQQQVADEAGIKPPSAVQSFADLHGDVRQSIARVRADPLVPHKAAVPGFVVDVATGRLREGTHLG